jgi:hypothetical protein
MIKYKLFSSTSVFKLDDDVVLMCIPFDPANTDYQRYLAWVAEGNTPLPAEDPQ